MCPHCKRDDYRWPSLLKHISMDHPSEFRAHGGLDHQPRQDSESPSVERHELREILGPNLGPQSSSLAAQANPESTPQTIVPASIGPMIQFGIPTLEPVVNLEVSHPKLLLASGQAPDPRVLREFVRTVRRLQAWEGPPELCPEDAVDRWLDRITGKGGGDWNLQRVLDMSAERCRDLAVHADEVGEQQRAGGYDKFANRFDSLRAKVPTPPREVSTGRTKINDEPVVGPSLGIGANVTIDFSSEDSRIAAVKAYAEHWTQNCRPCPEASLARAAKVHRADLSKWKRGGLPANSSKAGRIEEALRENRPPIPAPPKMSDA